MAGNVENAVLSTAEGPNALTGKVPGTAVASVVLGAVGVLTSFAVLPGLTIAALNGTLAGGSLGMALACDLRIAVPSANIFYPVMKRGFLPQPSDPQRMAALIGPARTKLILIAGQKISADEAYGFGLIDRIVPSDELIDTARALAADTLAADPEIARGIAALCQ